ncbi:hypothetical protein D1007_41992 [Hordeum vulgare]|nr:hypothetical protein D1007_41992 [Hordeum vulgare]
MAARLLAGGYAVTAYARTPAKAVALVAAGASLADSPASVAAASDVVFTMVGNPGDVRAVVLDAASGALAGLRPGGVFVDCTSSPREVAAAARAAGCPVSGGDVGDEAVVAWLGRLFAHLGRPTYMGPAGCACASCPTTTSCAGVNVPCPFGIIILGFFFPSLVPSPLGSTAGYKYVKRLQDTQHTASSKHPFN